jgi:signal transduction histidine kinase
MTRARVAAFGRRFGDLGLAVAVTAFTQVDIWTADDYLVGSKPVYSVLTLAMTLPLAFRRRAPLAVALTIAAALAAQAIVEPSPHPPDSPFLAWLIACYSVAAHARLPSAIAGGAALIVAILLWAARTGDDPVFIVVILGGFWLVGRIVRSRNLLAEQLAERTRELEAEREERARLAVAEERARIARELHDVVAHTLSVIVVQAGAERLASTAGDGSREMFASIERAAREALAEMGRLLGMLREVDAVPALGPQPSLARLEELLDGVRETGLLVDLVVEGEPRPLSPGLDVSAYRIVQEALTNTIKHAQSRSARVRIHWEPASLEIEIADDGIGPPASDAADAGHGLLGIRERVALFGGALVTGRSELGGYLLAARLPLSPT